MPPRKLLEIHDEAQMLVELMYFSHSFQPPFIRPIPDLQNLKRNLGKLIPLYGILVTTSSKPKMENLPQYKLKLSGSFNLKPGYPPGIGLAFEILFS